MLIGFLMFLLSEKTEKNGYRVLRKKRPSMGAKLFTALTFLDILSFALRYLFTIALPRRFGYTILVEEYVPGTMADYLFWWRILGKRHRLSAMFLDFAQRLFYENKEVTTTFYLDGPTETLIDRICHRNTYTEELDYIEMQHLLLLNIARYLTSANLFHYIDTSVGDLSEVTNEIFSIVDSKLEAPL
jgi:hypothetical protein